MQSAHGQMADHRDAEWSATLTRDHEASATVEPRGRVADVNVQGQPVVALLDGACGERVEQATTDTATTVGGSHRDDELGDRRAGGCRDQQGFPEVPPGRTDRLTIVVERQHTRVR